jgi:hypothetical protein
MHQFQVRPIAGADLYTPFDWARQEGWNPGLHDQTPFTLVDPRGFIGGYLNNELVATISAVRYDQHFGFIGFYIVAPAHRGKGYGLQVWNAGMNHLKDLPCVGLDGVLAQTENYQRSGFRLAHKNCRYEGKARQLQASTDKRSTNEPIQPLSDVPFETLARFDAQHFPTPRAPFLESWITQPGHRSLAIMRGKEMCGYGVIRACSLGHKIGPLFAQTDTQARSLIAALCSALDPSDPVYIDPPATHLAAINLAQSLGMEMVFETARMYKGQTPNLPIEQIYGVTSFELG